MHPTSSLGQTVAKAIDQAFRQDGHDRSEWWQLEIANYAAETAVGELEAAGTPVLHTEVVNVGGKRWASVLHAAGVELLRLVTPPNEEDRDATHVRRRFIGRPPGLRYHEELTTNYGGAVVAVISATGMDEPLRIRVRPDAMAEASRSLEVLRRWAREGEH